MNRVLRLFPVLVLAAWAGVPAAATPDSTGGGLTCGLLTTGDGEQYGPHGPEDRHRGHLSGGPWAAPVSAEPAYVEIRCTVQLLSHYAPPQVVAVAQAGGPGGAVLAPAEVVFSVPRNAMATVMVCTEVSVTTSSGVDYRQYDADGDPRNGAQCQQAEPDGTGVVTYFAPPQADGDLCAWARHGLQPPPYDTTGACVPYGPLGGASR